MTPGLAVVTGWRPETLARAAAGVGDLSGRVTALGTSAESSAVDARRSWSSPGADSAFAAIGRSQANVELVASALGTLQAALDQGATAIGSARDVAIKLAAQARAERFDVADDGRVTDSALQVASVPAVGALALFHLAALRVRAVQLTAMVKVALHAVGEADERTADAVTAAMTGMEMAGLVPSHGHSLPPLPAVGAESEGPGWEFTWKPNWAVTAASGTIGMNTGALDRGAQQALRENDDKVLGFISGDLKNQTRMPLVARAIPRGLSRLSVASSLPMTQTAVQQNIESGMDTPTAYISEYAGAGVGLVAGDLAASLATRAALGMGMVSPLAGVGIGVAGIPVSAGVSAATGWLTTKTIQGTSHWIQGGG